MENIFIIWASTIGDLAKTPVELLTQRFGRVGTRLHEFAHGRDSSPVDPHALDKVKSIGHQITLPHDYTKKEAIKIVLLELAEAVCRRARLSNYQGKTVSLYVRGNDFSDLNRSASLHEPTAYPPAVYHLALKLFQQYWFPNKPVRLLGISLSNLTCSKYQQLSLFAPEEKLYTAIDEIKNKFGEKSLLRGSFLLEEGVFYNDEKY